MKTPTIFKSLTTFKTESEEGRKRTPHSAIQEDQSDVDMFDWSSSDPSSQQWESIGLHSGAFGFGTNEFFRDIDGKGTLCFVRLSKRNLPARVIRERTDKMADDVEARTGRKPGRKERRDLQEEATMALLPKAFINHTIVPVVFTSDGLMMVFTTTPKRYETIVAFFLRLFGDAFNLNISVSSHPVAGISPAAWMTSKAISLTDDSDTKDDRFVATDFAVMKGDEIGVIRVKDRELGCAEVRAALKSGYRIEQIGLYHASTGMTLRLTLDLTMMQIKFADGVLTELRENMDEDTNEVHATAWMVITEYRKLLEDLALDLKEPLDRTDEGEDEL